MTTTPALTTIRARFEPREGGPANRRPASLPPGYHVEIAEDGATAYASVDAPLDYVATLRPEDWTPVYGD